jgi:hypothetical protein
MVGRVIASKIAQKPARPEVKNGRTLRFSKGMWWKT